MAVQIDVEEIEPGHEPGTRAVVARVEHLAIGEDGGLARAGRASRSLA